MKPAIFLDRDGTIIRDVPYLTDPALVQLLPGAAQSIRTFESLGFACVVVTNQSAIGRGLLSLERLDEIHAEMIHQLNDQGARLDGIYFSTAVPNDSDRTVVEEPDRKPGPGMLLRAARDLQLDLRKSWIIGDMISDVLAGRNAGCMGAILLRNCQETEPTSHLADMCCSSLMDAARLIATSLSLRMSEIGVNIESTKEVTCCHKSDVS